MSNRVRQLLRWAMGVSLFGSLGSVIAAVNWHGTWRSFALAGAEQSPPTTSVVAVEAQAMFQQWVIVALVGLLVGVASRVLLAARATDKDNDRARLIEA